MTDRWSPPYTRGQLEQLFKFTHEELVMLAEVGMLRLHASVGPNVYQVYGLGSRHLAHEVAQHAEAAQRLQGDGIPAEAPDYADRQAVVFSLQRFV